jgi:hypothetical protein
MEGDAVVFAERLSVARHSYVPISWCEATGHTLFKLPSILEEELAPHLSLQPYSCSVFGLPKHQVQHLFANERSVRLT